MYRGGLGRTLGIAIAVTIYIGLIAFAAFNYCAHCRVSTSEEFLQSLKESYQGPTDGKCQLDLKQMGLRDVQKFIPATEEEVIRQNPSLQKGGVWQPNDCEPWQNVAIIIPYRNREETLYKFLRRIHPMLQAQKLRYRIILAEQAGTGQFNRAKLFNVGYLEAMKLEKFDCLIFHDVDLLPEDDRNLYMCDNQARHLETATDDIRYHLKYWNYAGGVVAINIENFIKINGYPNLYWGWGSEDDDFSARITGSGLFLVRPPELIGKYQMVPHKKSAGASSRYSMFFGWRSRWSQDGLNDKKGMSYSLVQLEETPLFTRVLADIGSPPPESEIDWDHSQDLSLWNFLKFYYP